MAAGEFQGVAAFTCARVFHECQAGVAEGDGDDRDQGGHNCVRHHHDPHHRHHHNDRERECPVLLLLVDDDAALDAARASHAHLAVLPCLVCSPPLVVACTCCRCGAQSSHTQGSTCGNDSARHVLTATASLRCGRTS